MRRVLKLVGLLIAVAVTLLLGVGAIWEQVERQREIRDFPAPGRLVDIGGRRIQIDCRGTGSPTVVFESGLGIDGSLSWTKVQDEVAQFTRACAYCRAGIIWSDDRMVRTTAPAWRAISMQRSPRPTRRAPSCWSDIRWEVYTIRFIPSFMEMKSSGWSMSTPRIPINSNAWNLYSEGAWDLLR